MGSKQPAKDFDWGYLIQPDKSPSPRLEQLCLGLAGVIVNIPRPLVFFYFCLMIISIYRYKSILYDRLTV